MKTAYWVSIATLSLALTGCADEAGPDVVEEEAPELSVASSALTSCVRHELFSFNVMHGGPGWRCDFRLMINNFDCAEGVVGQASTEILNGTGSTYTVVATKLFDGLFEGRNGWASPATIATQWGHAYASSHYTTCRDASGLYRSSQWNLDPFTKTVRLVN